MCLSRLLIGQGSIAYKVVDVGFDIKNRRIYFPLFNGTDINFTLGRWSLIKNRRFITYGSSFTKKYVAGFHSFVYLKDALLYKNFDLSGSIILEVKIKGEITVGYQSMRGTSQVLVVVSSAVKPIRIIGR